MGATLKSERFAVLVGCLLAVPPVWTPSGSVGAADISIEVTGTRIPRVDAETAFPVTLYSADEIQRSGAATLQEFLRSIPQNLGGQNELARTSFSPGAASISLRGLGSHATLVLLNGRRLSSYAYPAFAQVTFVDLNSIPAAAIERVEVLRDGASPIYGSDAIAGVVNIITRKDYEGAEATAAYGRSQYWDGDQTTLFAAGGWGNLARDRFNVFANYSYVHRDPVFLRDRDYPFNSQDLRGMGYFDLRTVNAYPGTVERTVNGRTVREALPGCDPASLVTNSAGTQCAFDASTVIATVPRTDSNAVFARGQLAVAPEFVLFAELGAARFEVMQNTTPAQPEAWLRATDVSIQSVSPLVLPVGHPQNRYTTPVIMRYAFMDLGPRTSSITTDSLRGLAGARATWGSWDVEAAVNYNRIEARNIQSGYLDATVLREIVANGTYVFGDASRNAPELYARLSPTLERKGTSTLKAVDVKASSWLWDTSYGQVGVAVGGEYRNESLVDARDPLIAAGDIVGIGTSGASGQRNASAAFAELSVPAYRDVELQLALRTDKYDDYGRSTTPKVGVRWTPTRELLLRGAYSRGFRAPALPEVADAVVTGFYNGILDPARCPATGSSADCAGTVPVLTRSNASLKPETSTSITLGVVFEPVRHVSIGIDYFDVTRNDEIRFLDPAFLLGNEALYPGRVIRNAPVASGLPGSIRYFNQQYVNIAATEGRGYDVDARLRVPLGSWGELKLTGIGSYIVSGKSRPAADQPFIDYLGTRELPRFRGTATATVDHGPWSATVTLRYTGGYDYRNSPLASCPLATAFPSGCSIKAWAPINVYAQYTGFKDLTLFGYVRNIQNLAPPVDLAFIDHYDPTYHDIYGRYFTVGVRYVFR